MFYAQQGGYQGPVGGNASGVNGALFKTLHEDDRATVKVRNGLNHGISYRPQHQVVDPDPMRGGYFGENIQKNGVKTYNNGNYNAGITMAQAKNIQSMDQLQTDCYLFKPKVRMNH